MSYNMNAADFLHTPFLSHLLDNREIFTPNLVSAIHKKSYDFFPVIAHRL